MFMNRRELLMVILIFVIVVSCFYIISSTTFAYPYDSSNYTLFYKEDKLQLKNDIEKYLMDVDDFLIVNTDYTYSDVLSENYNYLVYFAFDYILKNKERYLDKIIHLDSFNYYNKYYSQKNTDEYVPIELVYSITDKFFGKRDFKIVNDDVNIIGNYISVIDYSDDVFLNQLIHIDLEEKNDYVLAYVTYDYGKYLFSFFKKYHVLKLYDIEVLS